MISLKRFQFLIGTVLHDEQTKNDTGTDGSVSIPYRYGITYKVPTTENFWESVSIPYRYGITD